MSDAQTPDPTGSDLDDARRGLARRLLTPTVVLLIFIVAFPLVMQIYISLTWWTPLDGDPWYHAWRSWAWVDNYTYLFTDPDLWGSVWRTLLFVAVAVPIEVGLGLALAALFYEGVAARPVLYSLILMPMMIVPAVAGYIFFLIFQQTGPLNAALSTVWPGALDVNWLNDTTRAFIAVVIADVWQWTPLMFLILFAGLMSVPDDQMRAATLLGANWRQRFMRIALPRIKTVIAIAIGLRVIECFKIFDMLFVMTGGGPGVATESLSLFLYKRTFQDLEWSYVAAIGITVLVLLSVLTALIMAAVNRCGGDA
ncbi:carbohydrate ABC transporter permease [Roseobacter litoralis]|uniref:ABC transporter permease protein n=1 Tax=Roseobacter litoralis (strain ATCC 49566 / DSM 6996 / JCM 21268 / NBRC 15278 / OCh 149) TaxID=391595 RepID=F7ZI84_ROSLO|nr:sugar ABC transporter permease [Roseobacter litoralis]AEI96220.1 ABC transporter permease protein [Roseobacter litoralis Och 149]